jgi:exopolyphosphatase/guanosine-5'-triphosphate,3'-diphosphate pyrophosphatase
MSSRRFAFIDIGTNTILGLIAELKNDGNFDVPTILRKSRGWEKVSTDRPHQPRGEERSLKVLRCYLERFESLNVEAIMAVGTSALRDARNSAEVRGRFKEQLGFDVRVISGDEEAAYSFLAVQRDFLSTGGNCWLSTSAAAVRNLSAAARRAFPRPLASISRSVRLTEQFIHSDPVRREECETTIVAIERELASLPRQWLKDSSILTLVGIAGTFTTLSAVEKKLVRYAHGEVHGSRLTLSEVRRQVALYQGKTIAERKAIDGLEPKRADVILAGATLIERTMTLFHLQQVIVSDHGVRYGLLHECLKYGN